MFKVGMKVKNNEDNKIFDFGEYEEFIFTGDVIHVEKLAKRVCVKVLTSNRKNTVGNIYWLNFSDVEKIEDMTKSTLKENMIIETKDGVRYLKFGNRLIRKHGYISFENYLEDLTNKSFSSLDIVKVYKCDCPLDIDSIFDDIRLEVIWERSEREIDWNKVPRWTKIQVRNTEKEEWKNRYFRRTRNVIANGERTTYYLTVTNLPDDFTGSDYRGHCMYKYCRIHPSVEVSEEWYK